MTRILTVIALAGLSGGISLADNQHQAVEKGEVTEVSLRVAISKAASLLEKASAGSADKRRCFTCHNQAVPVFALVEARTRGFKIDEANLARQLKHTSDHLQRGLKNYKQGKGQGGKVLTAGYALWALHASGQPSDETTTAVVHYLLEYQKDVGHWHHRGSRPPSSGSDFTTTFVAIYGLSAFGNEQQQHRIKARVEAVRKWLKDHQPQDTEDRVFRLRMLECVGTDEETVAQYVADLLKHQREDGGWAQKRDLGSDAYATATVLVALLRSGHVKRDHPALRRGIKYLLTTQQPDGSWHVKTRAKGFQKYYETGFPHGKDQFISTAATGWAALALLLTLPEPDSATDSHDD